MLTTTTSVTVLEISRFSNIVTLTCCACTRVQNVMVRWEGWRVCAHCGQRMMFSDAVVNYEFKMTICYNMQNIQTLFRSSCADWLFGISARALFARLESHPSLREHCIAALRSILVGRQINVPTRPTYNFVPSLQLPESSKALRTVWALVVERLRIIAGESDVHGDTAHNLNEYSLQQSDLSGDGIHQDSNPVQQAHSVTLTPDTRVAEARPTTRPHSSEVGLRLSPEPLPGREGVQEYEHTHNEFTTRSRPYGHDITSVPPSVVIGGSTTDAINTPIRNSTSARPLLNPLNVETNQANKTVLSEITYKDIEKNFSAWHSESPTNAPDSNCVRALAKRDNGFATSTVSDMESPQPGVDFSYKACNNTGYCSAGGVLDSTHITSKLQLDIEQPKNIVKRANADNHPECDSGMSDYSDFEDDAFEIADTLATTTEARPGNIYTTTVASTIDTTHTTQVAASNLDAHDTEGTRYISHSDKHKSEHQRHALMSDEAMEIEEDVFWAELGDAWDSVIIDPSLLDGVEADFEWSMKEEAERKRTQFGTDPAIHHRPGRRRKFSRATRLLYD